MKKVKKEGGKRSGRLDNVEVGGWVEVGQVEGDMVGWVMGKLKAV